jgi:hypothetical protein
MARGHKQERRATAAGLPESCHATDELYMLLILLPVLQLQLPLLHL